MDVNNLPLEMQSMRVDILSCQGCGIRKECNSPVPFYGDHTSPIMFIARNPGKQEDLHGLPLYPKSEGLNAGRIFNRILEHLKLDREQVYVTNTVKCFTTQPKENRPPTGIECRLCAGLYLIREIDIVKPELIVTMGKEAFGTVARGDYNFGPIKITKLAGQLTMGLWGIPVFPLMHPASMLHNQGYKIKYRQHVFALKDLWFKYRDAIYRREFKAAAPNIING